MPNGGVPLHLVLEPAASSNIVLHCKGAELSVHERAEWDDKESPVERLLYLSPAESHVLARFLRYWLDDHDEGVIYRQPGVQARYDF